MIGGLIVIIIFVAIVAFFSFLMEDDQPPAGSTPEEILDFRAKRDAIAKSKREAENRSRIAAEIVSRQAYFAKLDAGYISSGRKLPRCFLGMHDWATYNGLVWSTLYNYDKTTYFQKCTKCGLEQYLMIGIRKNKWSDTSDGTIAHSILSSEQRNGRETNE